MSSDERVKASLNVLRRMPPADVTNNFERLVMLNPDLDEELCQRVDQPLKVQEDTSTGKNYLLCDYNRDGDSFRSPWSNEYFPPIEDDEEGFTPSPRVRQIEKEANAVFDTYRHLYFEGGYSSVYCWDLSGENFASGWLVRKDVSGLDDDDRYRGLTGQWNSIHVFEVTKSSSSKWLYKLTSTVIVSMKTATAELGNVDLSGSVTQQAEKSQPCKDDSGHIANMGAMVEEIELALRNKVEGIYMQKTQYVINGMRTANADAKRLRDKAKSLAAAAAKR